MSWKSLAPHALERGKEANRISIEVRDVRIRLDVALITRLGWKLGDRVDVMMGTGEHLGTVRLQRSTRGWMLHALGGSRSGPGGAIKMTKKMLAEHVPDMPDSLRSHYIEVSEVGGGVEFRLPWIKPKEETVEQAVARGVRVKQIPAASRAWANGGNPVRAKAGQFSNGRVR